MSGEESDKVEKEYHVDTMTRKVVETKLCGEMEVYVEVVRLKKMLQN